MLVVAVTIAVLLALVVGLLAVPVVFVVEAERTGTLYVEWRVCWLFGLVIFRSTRRGAALPRPKAVNRQAQTPTKDRKRGRRMAVAAMRTSGLVRRVAQLAMTLRRQVKFERLHVDGAFGLGDPAATGLVYGFLSPLLLLADARGLDIRCTPMFLECDMRGVLNATIHVRPLSVVSPMMAFLASPPVLRAIGAVWRAST